MNAPARPRRLFALVDCSAFYCSCERVFDPALDGVPVAVLSNNDGCVIARSDEVKAAGIRMGEPFFKCRDALAAIGARVFSSNYALYGDMSRRVMACLHTVTPDVEVYSVDEAFLSLPVPEGTPEQVRIRMEALASDIRRRVFRWTGIPVRVSLAETKTLAKAASELAKRLLKEGQEPCVCLYGHPAREAWLDEMDVADVWGVGRRWAATLRALGGGTAGAFARLPDRLIRDRLNVVGLRTAFELRGIPCLRLDDAPVARQTLVKSRSFGTPVSDLDALSEAVSTHAARAAEKLRREGLVCGHISVFITTKGYGPGPHRSAGTEAALHEETSDTAALIRAARACLRAVYRERCERGGLYRYRKAGVTLWGIRPAGQVQRALFAPGAVGTAHALDPRRTALMAVLDDANRRYGARTVVFGSMGTPTALRRTREASGAPVWEMRRQQMTPRYTTRWDELCVVHAF